VLEKWLRKTPNISCRVFYDISGMKDKQFISSLWITRQTACAVATTLNDTVYNINLTD
jgi:hypothetical protein